MAKGRVGFSEPELESAFLALVSSGRIDARKLPFISSVDPQLFSAELYKWLANKLKVDDWRPSPLYVLEEELSREFASADLEKMRSALRIVYKKEVQDPIPVIDKFKEYLSFRIFSTGVKSSVERYGMTKNLGFSLDDAEYSLQEAKAILKGSELELSDFAGNFPSRERERKRRRDNPDLHPVLKMGIQGIDMQVRQSPGTVTGWMAPFKRYKSIMLCCTGYAALLQMFNVAHILFENSIELTESRYDAMVSDFNYDRMVHYLRTSEENTKLQGLFELINSWPNRLKIIKAIPNETTVADVERELDRLQAEEGFVADVTVWDYMNLIRPSKKSREERLEQTTVLWDLVKHAQNATRPKICSTAYQSSAAGLNVSRIGQKHFGKSIGIQQALTSAIAINQTEEERRDGLIVLTPMFIRDGDILEKEVTLNADLSRMCVSREMDCLWREVEK